MDGFCLTSSTMRNSFYEHEVTRIAPDLEVGFAFCVIGNRHCHHQAFACCSDDDLVACYYYRDSPHACLLDNAGQTVGECRAEKPSVPAAPLWGSCVHVSLFI
jgi:hypothetical protein